MKTIIRLPAALALAAGLLALAPAQAAIKCWTNNEGVRECGNAIPPEYAQQENRTVNQRGVTTDMQQRAKTGAELEAEQQRIKAEEERAAEERRQQEARIKADQVLLATFASEEDITRARDRKITALEGTIELTGVSINKQQEKIDEYRKRIANLERAGKPVPAEMQGDMAMEQEKLDNKQAFIANKRIEVEALRAEYEGYLARYRQLMLQRP